MQQSKTADQHRLHTAILARQVLHVGRDAMDALPDPGEPSVQATVAGTEARPLSARARRMAELCPLPGQAGLQPDSLELARLEQVLNRLLADDATPLLEASFEPRAIALQLVMLARLAEADRAFVAHHLDDQTLGLCGLWRTLRAAGHGSELPTLFDAAADALSQLVAAAPAARCAPLALTRVARGYVEMLQDAAPALAATLPEDTLHLLSRVLRGAAMVRRRDPHRGRRLINGVTAEQEMAIAGALPPPLASAIHHELRHRDAARAELARVMPSYRRHGDGVVVPSERQLAAVLQAGQMMEAGENATAPPSGTSLH